jgi:hypothetical protein
VSAIRAHYRESYRVRRGSSNVASFVAADKITAKFVRGAHNDEAACSRVYNKVSRIRNGTDQPRDKVDRLNVGVFIAIHLLDPSARNAMVAPRAFRGERRLLKNKQVIAAPPRPITVTDAEVVPSEQVNTFADVRNS